MIIIAEGDTVLNSDYVSKIYIGGRNDNTSIRADVSNGSGFPTGGKRCEYGEHQDGNGTSGDDHYQKVDGRSIVHFYCKYYEMEDK